MMGRGTRIEALRLDLAESCLAPSGRRICAAAAGFTARPSVCVLAIHAFVAVFCE